MLLQRAGRNRKRFFNGSTAFSAVARAHEPGLGEYDCLHAVAEPELHQHVADVCFDRGFADDEISTDFGVRASSGDKHEDLALAGGQLLELDGAVAWRCGPARKVLDQSGA